MNMLTALPIAAAMPVAAPAIAAEHSDDHAATLARAEQIVETLRTKYVADGWTLFEPAAEDMLGFFRRRLEGKPERDHEFKMDVVEFFQAHGQSLDWVLFGDPSVMICRLAAAKSEERGEADAEVVEMGEKFKALLPTYVDQNLEWARLSRATAAEVEAKFGDDRDSDDWSKPDYFTSPAGKFLEKVHKRNGCRRAVSRLHVIHEEMEPLAELIRDAEVTTVPGLRAKAMVAIWDCLPAYAEHEGGFSFGNADSHFSLFHATVAISGLSDMASAIDDQLAADWKSGIPQE